MTLKTIIAHHVRIDSDEEGFELRIEDEEGFVHTFNVHGCAQQLLDAARKEIGPWASEGERFRGGGYGGVADSSAYEPGSAKHTTIRQEEQA
jgi:hypothetical protein